MAFELIKVSELPELTTPSDPNVMPIQDGDYLKRISFQNLKEALTGDIADDLEAEVTAREEAVSGEATAREQADAAILADLAAEYDATATYAVGDYVIYEGQLYRCTTAIETAEAWTASHWTAVQLGDEVGDLRSALNELPTEEEITETLYNKADVITNTASGSVANFSDGAAMPVKDLTVNIEPVQSGSGDPSPTNIRPITGWDAVKVTRTGKNFFNKSNNTNAYCDGSNKVIYNSDIISVYVELFPNTDYVYSQSNIGAFTRLSLCDSLETDTPIYRLLAEIRGYETASVLPISFNSRNHKYMLCTIYRQSIDAPKTFDEIADTCQLELGSTVTDYEPYDGQSVTIQLGQTIYGGTLDVTSGVLTVDRGLKNLGEITWNVGNRNNADTGRIFSYGLTSLKANTDILCNALRYTGRESIVWETLELYDIHIVSTIVVVCVDALTRTEAKQALADTYICYYLATPFTVQLTPEQLSTIKGTNNIFADSGDVTVEYGADTKLYIEDSIVTPSLAMIAPIENGTTASQAYTAGQYFLHNNVFCKALTSIASGATFTLNTNYTETTIAAELYTALH